MKTKKERLNEAYAYAREHLGVHTKTDFARLLQITQPAMSSAINGNEAYLTKNLFQKICAAFPGVFNLDYLLNGIGELTLREKKIDATSNQNSRNVNENPTIDMSSVINSIIAAKDETIATLQKQLTRDEETIQSLRSQVARLDTLIAQQSDLLALLKSQSPQSHYPFPIGTSDELKKRLSK